LPGSAPSLAGSTKRAAGVLRNNDERARQVFEYMKKITGEAGLNARFAWDGMKSALANHERQGERDRKREENDMRKTEWMRVVCWVLF